MPKLGERKCPSCGDYSDPEQGEYGTPWQWANRSDRLICNGCYEGDQEHASHLSRFTNEGRETVLFGDEVAYETQWGEEIPDWFDEVVEAGARDYVRTDAWRGYYDTKLKGEYVKLGSGWVTGWASEESVSYKVKAIELGEFLNNEHAGWAGMPEGAELYWLIEPTSNIFSQASDLLVPVACAESVREWLIAAGFKLSEIKDSFE
jgi:hypothetical protein